MRGKLHKPLAGRSVRRLTGIGGALIAVLALAGCSVGNLTGFDFPSFGLTKKSDDTAQETAGSLGTPPSGQKLNTQ